MHRSAGPRQSESLSPYFGERSTPAESHRAPSRVPWPGPRRDTAGRDSRSPAVTDPSVDRGGTRRDLRGAGHRRSPRRLENPRTADRFPFCRSHRRESRDPRSTGIGRASLAMSRDADREMLRTRFARDWRLQLQAESDEQPPQTGSPAGRLRRRERVVERWPRNHASIEGRQATQRLRASPELRWLEEQSCSPRLRTRGTADRTSARTSARSGQRSRRPELRACRRADGVAYRRTARWCRAKRPAASGTMCPGGDRRILRRCICPSPE